MGMRRASRLHTTSLHSLDGCVFCLIISLSLISISLVFVYRAWKYPMNSSHHDFSQPCEPFQELRMGLASLFREISGGTNGCGGGSGCSSGCASMARRPFADVAEVCQPLTALWLRCSRIPRCLCGLPSDSAYIWGSVSVRFTVGDQARSGKRLWRRT